MTTEIAIQVVKNGYRVKTYVDNYKKETDKIFISREDVLTYVEELLTEVQVG